MELEKMALRIHRQMQESVELPNFRPGKVSLWLKYVRLKRDDGAILEETDGPVQKQVFLAASPDELMQDVAENILLFVFGAELSQVKGLPNLIIKLFDKKVRLQTPAAPALDEPDQLFLKATVYEYHPSLWEQLFSRRSKDEETE